MAQTADGETASRGPHSRLGSPDRVHGLLDAVMSLGRGLELSQVLRGIVEAAVTLTDAEYGALGVVGDGQRLSRFLPVGIADDLAARIGQVPCGRGILGELIRNPVPLRLTDLARHSASYGFPAHHPPMRTFLGVPIRVRDEVFGNLYLTEKRGGEFDADDEAVLNTLSVAAGMAIENARMYEESRRRERRVEALAEVTRALLTGTEAREVLDLIARRALEVAGADTAAVLIPAAGRPDCLVAEVAHGRDARSIGGRAVPARGSLAGLAASTGEPAVSRDIRSDERAHPFGGDPEAYGSTVAVPLPVETGGGALRLSRLAGRPAFDPAEVKLISGFADQAAIALELARRRAQSEELAVLHDRDRIARDLHDLAIQRLFATGMTLQSATRLIERPEAAERVGRAVDDLDDTIRIIRTAIFGLRSTGVGGPASGLRRRMAEAAQAAAPALGFAPALRIDGPVDSAVPDELAEHLPAVAAEALSNTARHAGAGRVDVHLAVTDDEVALTVADDGVGVGTAPHTGGLVNMRIRAELLGGALTVDSPPTGGTRIVWRVPLP
ncbi:GAF domain-containing protein [Streptomyces sp. NPDC018031]|uniref:sensor histidine kinase n=1 Tax=Streptomyces sp. NPDC018031 TaxID=3365033 RepID=UPI003791055E